MLGVRIPERPSLFPHKVMQTFRRHSPNLRSSTTLAVV